MVSRIKELRKSRRMVQSVLADEIGVTQQMLSNYERNIMCVKPDALIKLSNYFNVTTDYLLEISEVKRDLQAQVKTNKILDEYYNLIEIFKELDENDQEMVWSILLAVRNARTKRKQKSENTKKD